MAKEEPKEEIIQRETHFSSEDEATGFIRGVQYMDNHGMWIETKHFFEKESGYWVVELTMDPN